MQSEEIPNEEQTYRRMTKKTFFLLAVFMSIIAVMQGQNHAHKAYIKKYKKIAIKEMKRSGVPASIKLAQGILESNAGRSTLARKANNHFGMKCGSTWQGRTYYLEDDDYDESGRLIKSCFRVYRNVKECYIAHSEFLRDPRKRYRYGFLFQLDPNDYQAWARGLKTAGYATSPTYADKLIGIIERYKLYQYDVGYVPTEEPDIKDQILTDKDVIIVNGIPVVIADGNQTIRDIALNHRVPTKQLLKYNERINQQAAIPTKGDRVFLKRKRNGYWGRDKKYHQIKKGETIWDISQRYGVKLSKLLKRNRLSPGEEPALGERIKLRGWFKVKEKPKLRDLSKDPLPEQVDHTDDNNFMDTEIIDIEEELFDEDTQDENMDKPAPAGPVFHIVSKGETLYGIARRYNTTVDHIKSLNKLAVNIISVGQRLRVK